MAAWPDGSGHGPFRSHDLGFCLVGRDSVHRSLSITGVRISPWGDWHAFAHADAYFDGITQSRIKGLNALIAFDNLKIDLQTAPAGEGLFGLQHKM